MQHICSWFPDGAVGPSFPPLCGEVWRDLTCGDVMLSPATCIILYHFASRIEDWAKNGLLVQKSHWITISNHFYWKNPQKIPLKEVEPRIIGRNLMRYALTERNLLSYIRHPFIVRLHHAFQTPSCQGAQGCDPMVMFAQDGFHEISMFDSPKIKNCQGK